MLNRKHFTPEQKVAMVRRHLLEGVPVLDLCRTHRIQPTQYHTWQRQFFEHGAVVFQRRPNPANKQRQLNACERKISQLQTRLQQKNEVVTDLLREYAQLKKDLGEP
jgi:transposase-like protein